MGSSKLGYAENEGSNRMKASRKTAWIAYISLLLFLSYKWLTLAEDNHELKNAISMSQDRANQAFSYFFHQTTFEDYANLLDQHSTSPPENIWPKLDQVSDFSNEMRDRLSMLAQLQEPIQPNSPIHMSKTYQGEEFLIHVTNARLFPVVYWLQKSNEVEHRELQPLDTQLFRDVAKRIHEYDQKLSDLQELQDTLLQINHYHIRENFLQLTDQFSNDLIELMHDYEIKNNFQFHVLHDVKPIASK